MTKPRCTSIVMVKVDRNYQGVLYAPIDKAAETVLGGRKTFEAAIPVRGRSMPQNSLWAVWYGLIGREVGQTAGEVKAECKLIYGVPILRAENQEFRELYDSTIKPLSYELKLRLMDGIVQVTSLFSKGQGCIYTETLQREYAKQQIVLDVL